MKSIPFKLYTIAGCELYDHEVDSHPWGFTAEGK